MHKRNITWIYAKKQVIIMTYIYSIGKCNSYISLTAKFLFWYVEVCIFWKCIQYTIHWDKTKMLKKFPLDKIFGKRNALFCFRELQLITVLLLICDSYMSWSTRFVSLKSYVGFSFFDSVSFLSKFTFLFKKMHGLFDFKML